jgi:hypothetical protein
VGLDGILPSALCPNRWANSDTFKMLRILLINLAIVISLLAQDSSSVNFGLKGGLNLSYITGGNNLHFGGLKENHSKFGFNFGLILEKRFIDPSSIQVEFLYNNTGSKWGQPFIALGYYGDYVIYELRYISLSVYYKLKSKIGNLLKDFDFVMGVSYSYNISATQKWVVEYCDYEFDAGPSNIRNEINHHEIGLGLGVKFPFSNRKYYLNFLFYHALSPLYPDTYERYKDDFNNKQDMRNNTLSICFDMFM